MSIQVFKEEWAMFERMIEVEQPIKKVTQISPQFYV